jgi:AraC-like DNA-binding protein
MRFTKPRDIHSIPSATGGIARLACARMRQAGKGMANVLSKAGLTVAQVNDPTLRLGVRTQIKLLDSAAHELHDDFLGFHLARNFDLRQIGLLYYVMASSNQLADALSNAERYCKINNEGVRLRFRSDRAAVIALDYVNVDRFSDRHQIEFWLTTIVRICRQLTNNRLAPRTMTVRHHRDGTPAEFRSFLASDVEFDADADEIVFPSQIASLPIVGADTYLNRLLRQYADETLARQPARHSVRANVERVLPQLLPHGKGNTSEVARQLGLSCRTLSRSLLAEGVTFTKILEEVRAALARRYLRDCQLPVSEIAWLVGYQEVGSFTHAFKRWTGMTPRQFRSSDRLRGKRTDSSAPVIRTVEQR